MNDSDAIWQIKRGRPRKLSEDKYLKLNAYFKQSLTASELKYRKMKSIYINNSYSQKIENLILKILSMLELPYEVKHLPLLIIAQEAAKQMLISELELIVFAIIILKNNLAGCNLRPEELIKTCFFHSKLILESDLELVQIIREYLKNEISDFENKLVLVSGIDSINLRKINKWSKRLEEWRTAEVNYSYYVDSIILKAPPYKVIEKADKNPKKNNESQVKKLSVNKRAPRKKVCKEVPKVDFGLLIPVIVKNPSTQIIENEPPKPIVEIEEDFWYPKEDTEYGLENLDRI